MVVWMNEQPMNLNNPYLIKHTTNLTTTRIDEVRYKINVNTVTREKPAPLTLNEIGRVVFTTTKPIFHDTYEKNRLTGSFIIIDEITNNTVGAGMIIQREPSEILPSHMISTERKEFQFHISNVKIEERIARLGQLPATIWLTGLVGAGKSEIAYTLERKLFDLGASAIVLDGENMRLGISRDLDFTSAGQAENLRRAAEIAKLLNNTGIIVICAFTSPIASIRQQAANIIGIEHFIEVYVKASLDWCKNRDKTGLYARACEGKITNLPGINTPYEEPEKPALIIETEKTSPAEASIKILEFLRQKHIFPA